MTPHSSSRNRQRILGITFLLVILLPALFYSVYEINALTQSESLIEAIYTQQLDVVLFSLNQYAWDASTFWVQDMERIVREHHRSSSERTFAINEFLASKNAILMITLFDSTLTPLSTHLRPEKNRAPVWQRDEIKHTLSVERERIERLVRYRESNYRKLEALTIPGNQKVSQPLLLAILRTDPGTYIILTLVIDPESFIRSVLSQKINEAAGDQFVLAVIGPGQDDPVYANTEVQSNELQQTKNLWLFPDYHLGIRMKGQTIEELVRDRFKRNLILIGLIDLIIVAGAWLAFRAFRREMELTQLKSDFVSQVSHELRTPLSLIRMYGESLLMERVATEQKKREYYETIVRESERLTRLIDNVLNFSRMESGKKVYQLHPIQLNSVVRNVLNGYSTHIAGEGFTLVTTLTDASTSIAADAEAVTEAVLNLIDNAINYSQQIRHLEVTTGTTHGTVFVDVADRGRGISLQHQKKIFEKFYRIPSPASAQRKGSGLGLSLVRHIMDAHHGTISLTSREGVGSTFRLSFPAVPES